MSLKYIVVDGCQLQFQNGGQGTININPGQTSTKVKAGGKVVYKTIKFTVTNYVGGEITIPLPPPAISGSGEINASSAHVKVEGNKVILEGDTSATITMNGQKPSGSSTVPATNDEVIKVVSAGQTKVKGS